ncbi:MAG: DNA mismatch repair protein MutS [Crocinitomicaceae bacterium TMED45]|nr:MAG: DNA mismatch repair protein MutS [Crocinitomicaceae bacterium TMED45]
MKQYNRIKVKHPDTVLLFRVGDFYETFGADAVAAAKVLNIVLTKRGNGSASEVELAGFPHHSLDTYLPKLVKSGLKVAVCDQLEDPKQAKGLVKRGVTELVTPGLVMHDHVLESKANHYVAAIHWTSKSVGLALLDLSTGEFQAAEGDARWIDRILRSLEPKEWLVNRQCEGDVRALFGDDVTRTKLDDWVFTEAHAHDLIKQQFGTGTLKGFGLDDAPFATVAVGVVLHYLDATHHRQLDHLQGIRRLRTDEGMWLDRFTVRNLEILHPNHPDGTTLVDVLDSTCTPMGGRALRRALVAPLTELKAIEARHDAVGRLSDEVSLRHDLRQILNRVGDLERLTSKASSGRINPREVGHIRRGLQAVQHVADATAGEASLLPYLEQLSPCSDLLARLDRELVEEPAAAIGKGEVIASGVSAQLDEVRRLAFHSQEALDAIRDREAEATGISGLKIAFNNVFGYYLEVRNAHKDKVPERWIRKQTLTQAERYITEELKELEAQILQAKEQAESLELAAFAALVAACVSEVSALMANARALGLLDMLASHAETATELGYTRPRMSESQGIQISEGRHPVIERQLPLGETYVANDVLLDAEGRQILMVTGPNMSGKSALLRQTALISLMAQAGSFVPAKAADLGILDRIFTRVGASDNISSGESTFMVEMNETAAILNNLTSRSLVLLDEIGRGTSTYDGVSIAWAIAEHLHESKDLRPLTLFATHYHELNDMSQRFSRIVNVNVSVKEVNGKIVFLRKLAPGGSNHSFGIHVAQLAGMPRSLVRRAEEVLTSLEAARGEKPTGTAPDVSNVVAAEEGLQMSFFQLDDPSLEAIRDRIMEVDIDHLTPVEALMKLHEIKATLTGKSSKESLKA